MLDVGDLLLPFLLVLEPALLLVLKFLLLLLFKQQLLLLQPVQLLLLFLLKSMSLESFLKSVVLDRATVELKPVVDLLAEIDLVLLVVVVVVAATDLSASFVTTPGLLC